MISSTVCLPVHSRTISDAGLFRANPRSGNSKSVSPVRRSTRRRALEFNLGLACRFDIGRIQAIQQVPENVRLLEQRLYAAVLKLVGRRMLDDKGHCLLGVEAGPGHPYVKIAERRGINPWVMPLPGLDAPPHERGREQLREGRRHGFQERMLA